MPDHSRRGGGRGVPEAVVVALSTVEFDARESVIPQPSPQVADRPLHGVLLDLRVLPHLGPQGVQGQVLPTRPQQALGQAELHGVAEEADELTAPHGKPGPVDEHPVGRWGRCGGFTRPSTLRRRHATDDDSGRERAANAWLTTISA